MDLEVRAITEAERDAFTHSVATAFGSIPIDDEMDAWISSLVVDRTLAVFDDGRIVATAAAHSFELTVPGGARVPAAGVTVVGVQPTHRRRGLLTRMMDEQFDDVARRGEPLAVLTASETSIYGRFGYGLATFCSWWQLARDHASLATPGRVDGRFLLVDRADAPAIVGPLFDSVARTRVGEVTRLDSYWSRVYRERTGPSSDDADVPSFTVVHEDETGRVDGFARYAITGEWPNGLPSSTLRVFDLHAHDPNVEAALWEFLADVDLVTTIKGDDRPLDEPLRWRLADPRQLQVTRFTDHLWVRVLDIAAALSARTYAVADEMVVEVVDAFRPANDGCWLIDAKHQGGTDGATCARTDRAPDLALSIADLGALYLGGVTPSTLASAGRVHEYAPGALARADAFFITHPAPWCTTHF